MAPLASVAGVQLFNLQVGRHAAQAAPPPGGMQITEFSVGMPTFATQASQMAALDLIVTINTAAANLAGALDLPVWVAVPVISDWRWGADGDCSPWYPPHASSAAPALGGS